MEHAYYLPGVRGLLAPLQDFLDDSQVSEIVINRPQEVFVEKGDEFLRFDIPALTTAYLRRLFLLIANENKQTLTEASPILSGTLPCGSRVQLVIPQVSQYETLAIRKFTVKHIRFEDYEAQGFFKAIEKSTSYDADANLLEAYRAKDWQKFITDAIVSKKNILISGGTASGKTTFLNSCIAKIPLHERLITLEDTYEIAAAHSNIVRLKAIKTLGEKLPTISMQDLVQASLRLRPDRLIMGEIRGKEVFDFVSAASTGHSGLLATIHANNPGVAFMRMSQLYKLNPVSNLNEADIYKILYEVIDIIVQIQKTESGRGITEVYYKHAQ